ncbi:uncharacterized protein LOC126835888 isoform X2 [Adelges cooleyi]|uniref:uncharacterized protein LOC126835888 isoform X2 n=1 Tax=Adelges cooleyi TaxID=133065 RepID=UPI00217F7D35|nr:uncharacterized protein LOC126835888 isoform X2 [Adelges cooleyi]
MIFHKLFILILITARNAYQRELQNNRESSNQLNTRHYITKSYYSGPSHNNNDVVKDPNDDILADAVEQLWKSGLINLRTKIAFNGNQNNQRDSDEFAITTICYSNGTCRIRQASCSCDTAKSQKECNDLNSGLNKKNVTNKTENSQSSKKNTSKNPSKTQPTKKPTQAVKPAGGLSNSDVINFRKQLLDQTNVYRKQHRVNKLTINEKMNIYAQDWANHLAKSSKLVHRKEGKYGENLFASSKKANLGKEAATSWYNEILNNGGYNFKADEKTIASHFTTYGHMTQLLWKNSKEMGVGISKSPKGMYIVVANYSPPGNVRGLFKDNVLPKGKP